VHGTSGRRAGPGRPGNWLTWCSVARQGPLHLIHGGGLVLFCRAMLLLPGKRERRRRMAPPRGLRATSTLILPARRLTPSG